MAMLTYDFEKPIVDLEDRIEALRKEEGDDPNAAKTVRRLEKELAETRARVYSQLTPMQRVLIARHIQRPRSLDYIHAVFTDWVEIKGDRGFRDDPAVVTGLGRFDGMPVAIVGQQKGKDTKENVLRNFGMMHPEGYRKALRLMRLAERFKLPIAILIDTPGAYPGIGAEERGQAEAIARNIMEMSTIRVPIVGAVVGEGASGGALGIGLVDYMMMFENSWYCVISPEGCAAILWRDAAMAPTAAETLRLTAKDLLGLQVVDESLPEPLGGAHRDPKAAFETLHQALGRQLKRLAAKPVDELLNERFAKYRAMGVYAE